MAGKSETGCIDWILPGRCRPIGTNSCSSYSLDEFVNKPVLSDAEILRLLAHERRQEIVKWTVHNYNSVFIPESWILACGLDSRWIS